MEEKTAPYSSSRISALELSQSSIPTPVEKEPNGDNGYIAFGEKNTYPSFVFDAYSNSTILQSIVNGLTDYVAGSGFATCDWPESTINRHGDTLLDVVQKFAHDYIIFGAGSLQVIRNEYKQILELYYVDVRRARLSKDEEWVYIAKDWANSRKSKPIKYKRAWKDNDPYADTDEIFYFKNPKSRGAYGLPFWHSAMKDIQTSIEISNFHLNSIRNNFTPSAIISFNDGEPDEAIKDLIERKLAEKFSGTNNASRFLLTWASDKEHGVNISRLSEDNFDKRYESLSKDVTHSIFTAFRAQPVLFGLDPERTAFNAIEYAQSFKLFKKTVVAPLQSEIENAVSALSPRFSFKLAEFNVEFDPVPAAQPQPDNTPAE